MNSASLRPGRRTPATTPPIPLLSALASGSDLLAHLVVESELLGLVNDTLLACQAYRAESTFSGILLERYYRELGQSVKDLDRFRRTIRQKLCECVRSCRASMADVPFAPGSAQLAVLIDPVVLRQSRHHFAREHRIANYPITNGGTCSVSLPRHLGPRNDRRRRRSSRAPDNRSTRALHHARHPRTSDIPPDRWLQVMETR